MKRYWVHMAVAAVLGLLTNIGVAWWSAWNVVVLEYQLYMGVYRVHDGYARTSLKRRATKTDFFWAPMTDQDAQRALDPSAPEPIRRAETTIPPPSWSRIWDAAFYEQAATARGPNMNYRHDLATGWPFRALCCTRVKVADPAARGGSRETYINGLAGPMRMCPSDIAPRMVAEPVFLPFEPIWPGFLGNTLLYAAPWFVLAVAPGVIRRGIRRRRNRCPGCGYDRAGLGAELLCPECGLAKARLCAPNREHLPPQADITKPPR